MKITLDMGFGDLPSEAGFFKIFEQKIIIDNELIATANNKSEFIITEVVKYFEKGFRDALRDVPWN